MGDFALARDVTAFLNSHRMKDAKSTRAPDFLLLDGGRIRMNWPDRQQFWKLKSSNIGQRCAALEVCDPDQQRFHVDIDCKYEGGDAEERYDADSDTIPVFCQLIERAVTRFFVSHKAQRVGDCARAASTWRHVTWAPMEPGQAPPAVMKPCEFNNLPPLSMVVLERHYFDAGKGKIGLHLIWPNVVVNRFQSLCLREAIVKEVMAYGTAKVLHTSNVLDDVIDRNIYAEKVPSLRMYGALKWVKCAAHKRSRRGARVAIEDCTCHMDLASAYRYYDIFDPDLKRHSLQGEDGTLAHQLCACRDADDRNRMWSELFLHKISSIRVTPAQKATDGPDEYFPYEFRAPAGFVPPPVRLLSERAPLRLRYGTQGMVPCTTTQEAAIARILRSFNLNHDRARRSADNARFVVDLYGRNVEKCPNYGKVHNSARMFAILERPNSLVMRCGCMCKTERASGLRCSEWSSRRTIPSATNMQHLEALFGPPPPKPPCDAERPAARMPAAATVGAFARASVCMAGSIEAPAPTRKRAAPEATLDGPTHAERLGLLGVGGSQSSQGGPRSGASSRASSLAPSSRGPGGDYDGGGYEGDSDGGEPAPLRPRGVTTNILLTRPRKRRRVAPPVSRPNHTAPGGVNYTDADTMRPYSDWHPLELLSELKKDPAKACHRFMGGMSNFWLLGPCPHNCSKAWSG